MYPESEWPERKSSKPSEALKEVKCERRAVEQPTTRLPDEEIDQEDSSNSTLVTTNENNWRLHPSRFSKWHRVRCLELGLSLVRVRSWVRRFIKNCRVLSDRRLKGELTASELQDTELEIIREAQREQFNEQITALATGKDLLKRSPLPPPPPHLTPMLQAGILRANTRVRQSDDLAEETKFPIILPKKHPVTRLTVKYHHEIEGHEMGVNYTPNDLREKYHVIHSRQEVKACIRNCYECKRRFRLHPAKQQMASLPKFRLQMTYKPFTNCATDFGGPYMTIQGRGRTRTKRYLCLFLCLQTHCCHLEMATSLDTGSFMNAFTRMTFRRGWPKMMQISSLQTEKFGN